ncbi:non-canonical purine NTP pyrophosphatase [Vallitalea okinawensis]|uniref:non-canonical purine NTP pyrophosphatase n=1 Tax=Vallitalea okinawensis TaxID=2078660 RepID=UPI000CFD2212|nr:non-canonical purine NTP pyrophosphatase [Vallitalea okinawensis]
MTRLLLGTKNETRKEYIKQILNDLQVEILSLDDLGITIKIKENGNNPVENSRIKAIGYYKYSNIPTLSIDTGLYIDKFPADKQPGTRVRRIYGDDSEASDEEMLNYYIEELKKCGGGSKRVWKIGITLVISHNEIYSTTLDRETMFTSLVCKKVTAGEPLNSIQIEPSTGHYQAELTHTQRKENQKELSHHINKFIATYLLREPGNIR